jgi:hypothetical protein
MSSSSSNASDRPPVVMVYVRTKAAFQAKLAL